MRTSRHGYRNRNSAIWALGQLGDRRAQPVLAELYTGVIPPREPLDGGISQYERGSLAVWDRAVSALRALDRAWAAQRPARLG